MSVFAELKIDCHAHVFDPEAFPYAADTPYRPSGQEIGTAAQLTAVMDAYGVKYAVLVQPNSGYGPDNSCMLDAVARGGGRFKGIAIASNGSDTAALKRLQAQGVIGAAINPTFYGNAYYKDCAALMKRLAELGLVFNLQVEHDQLLMFEPWIRDIPVQVLIDHTGRPTIADGLNQPGFQALLRIAETGRVAVKLSGYSKFSITGYPFEDCLPYIQAIVAAYGLDNCVWASDWPFLRAPQRQDYGPLVALAGKLFPDPAQRKTLFWDTPKRLFGF